MPDQTPAPSERRDPRRDPKPGDVLRYIGHVYEVIEVDDKEVHDRCAGGMDGGEDFWNRRDLWLEWMRNAEVIHAE